MKFRTGKALFVDCEMTCWEGDPPFGMSSEIIEIGIVELDTDTFAMREASYLVRPVRSEISDYCTALTGITPEEVKRGGRPLGEVLRTLAATFGPGKKSMLAWGDDWSTIDSDCRAAGVENPFPHAGFINFGQISSLIVGGGRLGLDSAREMAGLNVPSGRHRALADARATAELFVTLSASIRPGVLPPRP